MFKKAGYIVLTGFALLFQQCTPAGSSDDKPLAQVGDKFLYHSEMVQIIPRGMSADDSTKLADDYIKKWVRQELLIKKANENLTPEQKNLSKEIEEYRNSLIIYKYKNALLGEQMDTTVTTDQVETYYNNNTENFRLNTSILKGIFIKIPNDPVMIRQLKKLTTDSSAEGIAALHVYCLQFAKSFNFFTNDWVNFLMISKNLPFEIDDPVEILKQKSLIEQKDDEFYYVVIVFEYHLQNEIAPLEFVQGNIKNLILNKRKVDLLKQIEENIYKEGVRQNKFKIFKQ